MATKYIKPSGGTGSGADDISAWSPEHFFANQSSLISSGDTVLFKTGEIYKGIITPVGDTIVYGEYGTGAKPVITGLIQLSSWTLSSGNIYYASLDVTRLNLVVLDGQVRGMGRYPNNGYLAYTSFSGNASISGTSVGDIPFNPAGGEAVIRKNRWIIDRHPITSRSGDTLNISTNNDYGDNSAYTGFNGNGYFIQNHLGCLDRDGDWYYDVSAKRLYMYFSGSPSGRNVKAPILDKNIHIDYLSADYWANLTFNNLVLEGANLYGAYTKDALGLYFNDCDFQLQGGNGFYGVGVSEVSVMGGTAKYCLNNGIYVEYGGNNILVDGVEVNNIGMIAGAARSHDGNQIAIGITGDNTTIQQCDLSNIGYTGIYFSGDNILVDDNDASDFGSIKDDGGAIYTVNTSNATRSNRIISNNRIRNAQSAFEGAEGYSWEAFGKTAGIYLDDYANNVTVINNKIDTGDWIGIFLHNAYNNTMSNNQVWNFGVQLQIALDREDVDVSGNIVNNSRFQASAEQKLIKLHSYLIEDADPSTFAEFSDNRYERIGSNDVINIHKEYTGGSDVNLRLKTWKSTYNQDLGSISNPKVITIGGKLQTRNGKLLVISQ